MKLRLRGLDSTPSSERSPVSDPGVLASWSGNLWALGYHRGMNDCEILFPCYGHYVRIGTDIETRLWAIVV